MLEERCKKNTKRLEKKKREDPKKSIHSHIAIGEVGENAAYKKSDLARSSVPANSSIAPSNQVHIYLRMHLNK